MKKIQSSMDKNNVEKNYMYKLRKFSDKLVYSTFVDPSSGAEFRMFISSWWVSRSGWLIN